MNNNKGTFKHSVPVPRLLKCAARYVREACENGASIKELVYEGKHPNIKALYGLVVETVKKKQELDYLIKKSKILEKEPRLDPWLCRVLITELLWRKKRLPGESKPVKTVLAYKQILSAHCSSTSNENEEETQNVKKFKYVRVNTLKATVEEMIKIFRNEGCTFVSYKQKNNYEEFLSKLTALAQDEFMLDLHVDNLLIFPPKSEFHHFEPYNDGRIMLQDKASCLPVVLLNPPPGSVVLDMCAAPGMKTTQMAALMKNEGKIYAVEFNQKRFEVLNQIVEKSGATCIKTINRDVLKTNVNDFPDVEYILVDPSCSGSGIVERPGINTMLMKTNLDRLEKLAGFQILMLKAAFRRFPKAKRIVYSTCSVYSQENEEVVREVLASSTSFKLVPASKCLAAPWKSFGSLKYGDIGKFCLYSRPEKDYTNGFFIAVFERLEQGEENPFGVIDLEKKADSDDDIKIVEASSEIRKKKNKRKKLEGHTGNLINENNGETLDATDKKEIYNVDQVSKSAVIDVEQEKEIVGTSQNKQVKVKKAKKRKYESIDLINIPEECSDEGNKPRRYKDTQTDGKTCETSYLKKIKKRSENASEENIECDTSNEDLISGQTTLTKSKKSKNEKLSLVLADNLENERLTTRKEKKKKHKTVSASIEEAHADCSELETNNTRMKKKKLKK